MRTVGATKGGKAGEGGEKRKVPGVAPAGRFRDLERMWRAEWKRWISPVGWPAERPVLLDVW